MKKLIIYTLLIGFAFSFVPMFAKNNIAVVKINKGYLKTLEKVKNDTSVERLKKYGIDYDSCKKILVEGELIGLKYSNCIDKIAQSKYDFMLGKI